MEKVKLAHPTVARESPGGGWWLMNGKEGGYSRNAYGIPTDVPGRARPFPNLHAILERWDVELGRGGTDEHGVYIESLPRRDETRAPPSSQTPRGR